MQRGEERERGRDGERDRESGREKGGRDGERQSRNRADFWLVVKEYSKDRCQGMKRK